MLVARVCLAVQMPCLNGPILNIQTHVECARITKHISRCYLFLIYMQWVAIHHRHTSSSSPALPLSSLSLEKTMSYTASKPKRNRVNHFPVQTPYTRSRPNKTTKIFYSRRTTNEMKTKTNHLFCFHYCVILFEFVENLVRSGGLRNNIRIRNEYYHFESFAVSFDA